MNFGGWSAQRVGLGVEGRHRLGVKGIGCGGEVQTGHVLLHLLLTDVRLDVKSLAHAVVRGEPLLRSGNGSGLALPFSSSH